MKYVENKDDLTSLLPDQVTLRYFLGIMTTEDTCLSVIYLNSLINEAFT